MASTFDTDDLRPNAPQTESSEERGFVDEATEELGQAESNDDDGDIADEGPGHRG